jgi:hypothetical protein
MIRFIAGDTHRHLSTSGKRHSTTTWDRGLSMRYRGRRSSGARAIGAVVARFVHTEEVTGSNPVSPTVETLVRAWFLIARVTVGPR